MKDNESYFFTDLALEQNRYTRSDFMLKSKANWKFYDDQNMDRTTSIVEQLLEQKGLLTKEKQDQFLHPDLKHIQAPTSLVGVEIAKERIFAAIESQEKIIVYGDYDADGVTATALLIQVLRKLGAKCDYYIPNRFIEGYGLHKQALEDFQKQGVSLVITVDNGIANCVEADYAKLLGIDLIISDHHEVQSEVPDALAVIHPALSPDYSFKHLAGVGVAFQLGHYLLGEMPTDLLDLVAIGTIADLVPLLGENRVFTTFGLQQLADSKHVGIDSLKQLCNLNEIVTARDVGFLLAPRLNAVGRLQDASLAVELLLTEDEQIAQQIAEKIQAINTERQQLVTKIAGEAEQRVDDRDGFIILYDRNWHEGVLGIAASRLVQKFDRPVMMLTYNDETGELKGSARSIPAFNLFAAGMKIKHLFTQFGGHSQAAGMTFPFENLEEIKEVLNEEIFAQLTKEEFKQEIPINQTLSLDQLTEEFVQQINVLAPFGMGNEEPIFHLKGKPNQIRQLGQDNNHLKIQFVQGERRIEAIGFQFGYLYHYISSQANIELVGTLQINEWNGNRTVQLRIKDLAVNEWQLFDYRGRQNISSLSPYFPFYKHNLVVGNNMDQLKLDVGEQTNIKFLTYDQDISSVSKTDILYVYDLPKNLNILEKIVQYSDPSVIHVSYTNFENAYLYAPPARDDFKWLYAYLFTNSPVHLNVDLPTIMQMKQWSKDKIIFMLKVFLDLQFISIKDNVIYMNENTEKKELQTSKTYQQRLEQGFIEKTLYYSTYEELKLWFEQHLSIHKTKEETVHGL